MAYEFNITPTGVRKLLDVSVIAIYAQRNIESPYCKYKFKYKTLCTRYTSYCLAAYITEGKIKSYASIRLICFGSITSTSSS